MLVGTWVSSPCPLQGFQQPSDLLVTRGDEHAPHGVAVSLSVFLPRR
jgi:hypothetical protein